MSERIAAGPPAWVTKRDGRLEPFDADEICQALFAASEALGAPNAFLARELTDAVVHFLTADASDAPVTTAHIGDRVVQVVRELGQPVLAQMLAPRSVAAAPSPPRPVPPTIVLDVAEAPADLVRRCLRTYSERAVFSRDLVAAHGDGLVLLAGLDAPRALAAAVLQPAHMSAAAGDAWADLPARCAAAGQVLVLDAPEWYTAQAGPGSLPTCDRDWLLRLPALCGRHLVINLNAAEPPPWARQRGGGPLFADAGVIDAPALDPWLAAVRPLPQVRWHWHLRTRDFAAGPARDRLVDVVRRALAGADIAFVFDRPRRPVALAEGVDRQRPALLMELGLDLAAFVRLPGIDANLDAFRAKLPSLARMAISAAVQKRKYLRRYTDFGGFLLDRARLAVVPLGLDAAACALTGQSTIADAQEAARQIVHELHDHVQVASRAASLDACLDSPGPGLLALVHDAPPSAGLSCTGGDADPEHQLRAAGALHAIGGHGTARVLWPAGREPTVDSLMELLQFAWRRTEVVRFVLQRSRTPAAQPELDL